MSGIITLLKSVICSLTPCSRDLSHKHPTPPSANLLQLGQHLPWLNFYSACPICSRQDAKLHRSPVTTVEHWPPQHRPTENSGSLNAKTCISRARDPLLNAGWCSSGSGNLPTPQPRDIDNSLGRRATSQLCPREERQEERGNRQEAHSGTMRFLRVLTEQQAKLKHHPSATE